MEVFKDLSDFVESHPLSAVLTFLIVFVLYAYIFAIRNNYYFCVIYIIATLKGLGV